MIISGLFLQVKSFIFFSKSMRKTLPVANCIITNTLLTNDNQWTVSTKHLLVFNIFSKKKYNGNKGILLYNVISIMSEKELRIQLVFILVYFFLNIRSSTKNTQIGIRLQKYNCLDNSLRN